MTNIKTNTKGLRYDEIFGVKRLRVISQSPSVAKKDPRIWEGYGLDKRWHYHYNTLG